MEFYRIFFHSLFSRKNHIKYRGRGKNFRQQALWIFLLSAFFHGLDIHCIYAQSTHTAFRVKGLIVDSLSGKAVSFVTIQVQTDGSIIQGALSDESGYFSLLLKAKGKYDFLFHSVGYQEKKIGLVQVKSDSVTDIGVIALNADSMQLTGVTVSSIKPLV